MSAVGQRERNLEQRSTTSRTPRLQLKPSSSNSISHLTSSTPISRSKTHRRPISPPPPPPPPLTSNTQSFNRNSKAIDLPSRPISPTSLSPSHGPISFSRPTRASHLRQLSSNSVRSSISSNASSNNSIRSKRISQPVFLGSSNNGLSNNDQSENQTHSNHLSQKQVTHKPLPTPPTSSPSRDSFSTPTKSNSGQHPPPVNNNFQSQSNDLKSKFSVSPDTRNKRSRIRKEKERERANRSTDKKIFGGTGLSGDLENENGVTGETGRSGGNGGVGGRVATAGGGSSAIPRKIPTQSKNRIGTFAQNIKASLESPRPSLSESGAGGTEEKEDERFPRATSPLSFSFKESSSSLGSGLNTIKSKITNKTPSRLGFGAPRSRSRSRSASKEPLDSDSDWFASISTIRPNGSESQDVPPLPALPKPSFSMGLFGSVASPTNASFSSQALKVDGGMQTLESKSSAVTFPSSTTISPISQKVASTTRKESTSQSSTHSVQGQGRETRKVSIGPTIAPSEWRTLLRKDQEPKKVTDDLTSDLPIPTATDLPLPNLSERPKKPSVSTISSTSTSQTPFANARSLLRTTRSNLNLSSGRSVLLKTSFRNLNVGNLQENIRDSWIDLDGETAFMRGEEGLGIPSDGKNEEKVDGKKEEEDVVESQSGWWASLKLKKQKSFGGIGGKKSQRTASKLSKGPQPPVESAIVYGPSPTKVQRTSRSHTVSNATASKDSGSHQFGSDLSKVKASAQQRFRPPIPSFTINSSSTFKEMPPPSSTLNPALVSPSKKRSRDPESFGAEKEDSVPDLGMILETRAALREQSENFRPRPWMKPLKLKPGRSSVALSSSSNDFNFDFNSAGSPPASKSTLQETPIQTISAQTRTPNSLGPTVNYPPSAFNFSGKPPSLLAPPRSARSRASTVSSDDSDYKPKFRRSASRDRSGSINSEREKDLTTSSALTISSLILFNDIHGEENREEAVWKEREKARMNRIRARKSKQLEDGELPTTLSLASGKSGETFKPKLPFRSQSAMSFNSPAPTPPPREPLPLIPAGHSHLRGEVKVEAEDGENLEGPGGALGFFDAYSFTADVDEPERSFSPASTTFGHSRPSKGKGRQIEDDSNRRFAGVDWDRSRQDHSGTPSPSRSQSSPNLRSRMEEERPESAATWREASEATDVLSSLITRFEGSSRSPASSLGVAFTPKKLSTPGRTFRSPLASQASGSMQPTQAHSPAPTISLTPEKWQHEEMLAAYSRQERNDRRASGLTTGASIMTYESTEISSSESEYEEDQDDLESLIEGVVGTELEEIQGEEEETVSSPNVLSSSNLLSVQGTWDRRSLQDRGSTSSMESGSAHSGFQWPPPPRILIQGVMPTGDSNSPIFEAVGRNSLPSSQPSTFREGGNSSLESPVLLRSRTNQRGSRASQESDFTGSSPDSSSQSSSEGDQIEECRDLDDAYAEEMTCISSNMDESPCPLPRRPRSPSTEQRRQGTLKSSSSLQEALQIGNGSKTQGLGQVKTNPPRLPLQALNVASPPFVGLVSVPSTSSAWQEVMKGPRGGSSTTPKRLFKELKSDFPPSPPASTNKPFSAFNSSLLASAPLLPGMDDQTPPATVRLLAPAFEEENSPNLRKTQRNSFLEAMDKSESSYELSSSKELLERKTGTKFSNGSSLGPAKKSERLSSAPRITLTSESNEGHRDVDRPLSLGDSSFGLSCSEEEEEEEEEEMEVEVRTARVESVCTSRASTLFGRSPSEPSRIWIETLEEISYEDVEEGVEPEMECRAEITSPTRPNAHSVSPETPDDFFEPQVTDRSFFSPEASLDSIELENSQFDISNSSRDFGPNEGNSFFQFESTSNTSPGYSRSHLSGVKPVFEEAGDSSWETTTDSFDVSDIDESLDLLIENRRRFPDTDFSNYLLSVFKPPRNARDAAMFLLESRAMCRPLETGIIADAHQLTDRDYLDSPIRWSALSPEAENFIRAGYGAGEKIRSYNRPSTPASPTPGGDLDLDDEMGMKHYPSLSSMASEEAVDDFDVEEKEEFSQDDPFVYTFTPSPQRPSMSGMLFQSQKYSKPTFPQTRASNHVHHPSSSSISSNQSEQTSLYALSDSQPPLITLQSPTSIISPSPSSSH